MQAFFVFFLVTCQRRKTDSFTDSVDSVERTMRKTLTASRVPAIAAVGPSVVLAPRRAFLLLPSTTHHSLFAAAWTQSRGIAISASQSMRRADIAREMPHRYVDCNTSLVTAVRQNPATMHYSNGARP